MRIGLPAAVLVMAVALAGTVAFQQAQGDRAEGQDQAPDTAAPADPTAQPIAFPHDTHAGEAEGQFAIDCQYCHFSAERSVDAGLPTVRACAGCHQAIPGRNDPQEVQKAMGYANRGEPIPWVRIYRVPDHVHFPHMRHVQAEVECQECHGQVQEMAVIEEPAQPLTMGWCVTCHEDNDASTDCAVCHY
jgi:hypothetical protein